MRLFHYFKTLFTDFRSWRRAVRRPSWKSWRGGLRGRVSINGREIGWGKISMAPPELLPPKKDPSVSFTIDELNEINYDILRQALGGQKVE